MGPPGCCNLSPQGKCDLGGIQESSGGPSPFAHQHVLPPFYLVSVYIDQTEAHLFIHRDPGFSLLGRNSLHQKCPVRTAFGAPLIVNTWLCISFSFNGFKLESYYPLIQKIFSSPFICIYTNHLVTESLHNVGPKKKG